MRIKKWIAAAVSLMMMVAVLSPMNVRAKEPEDAKDTKVDITTEEPTTYEFGYGEIRSIKFTIKNAGSTDLTNVKVNPILEATWPFDNATQNEGYEKTVEKLSQGETTEITYDLKAKEDIPGGWYAAQFKITSKEGLNTTKTIRTKTTAKPAEEKTEAPTEEKSKNAGDLPMNDGGGVYNAEPGSSGGGSGATPGAASVPRVIVTGFSTEPGEVIAGTNFKLIIHLKNTSKTTAVSNMLFDLQATTEGSEASTSAPAFLPASGSSTVYLDKIPADGVTDIAIDLNARADLVQKPYSIAMTMKYEDGSKAQFEGTSSLSIPVKQAARFEFSDFEITPETIAIGEEGNVNCSLYNLGRTKLYNVKAKFTGNGISSKDVFVGNVEPGASVSIDGMLKGEKETAADNQIKMIVTYEDAAGALATTEKQFKLAVTEGTANDMAGMMDSSMAEPKGFPIIPIIIGVCILVGILVVVIIIKKKKKKALENEEGELADEIDRPSEDE